MARASRARRFGAGRLSKRWLAVAMLLLCPAIAAPDESAKTVVVVVPEGSPPLPLQRLIEALRSQLAELGVQVQLLTRPAGANAAGEPLSLAWDPDVLAFVWLKRAGDALTVHFYEPAGASLRERRIPVTGTDVASIEEVAIVVRSAANALLERTDEESAEPLPSVSRPPSRPKTATVRPAAKAPSQPSEAEAPPLQASLAYTGSLYASDSVWQHGAMASIAWRVGTSWRVGAAYSWFPPLRRRAVDLAVNLFRHPMEVFIGFETPVSGPRVTLRAEGAGIADPIVRRTSRASGGLEGTSPSTRWSWAVSTRLRLAWQPAAPWWPFVSGGADYLLNRFEHVVRNPEEIPVVSPLVVRPHLQVGVAADFP